MRILFKRFNVLVCVVLLCGSFFVQNIYSSGSLDGSAVGVSTSKLNIARGLVPNISSVAKFGHIQGVNTSHGAVDVWRNGNTYSGQPTGSPEIVEFFSSNANDSSAGTGMRTIQYFGLKTSNSTAQESDTVSLNGVTGVDSASAWYRIYRAKGLTYGSGATNAGNITIRHKTTTANQFAFIPAGLGQTAIAAFTIPFNSTGYLESLYGVLARSSGAAGSAQISLMVREFGSGGYNASRFYGVTTAIPINPDSPIYSVQFPSQSDIKMRIESVSDNGSEFSADIGILVVAD